MVKSYLDRRGIQAKTFANNLPTLMLKLFAEENIKRCRAAVSHDTVNKYFAELRASLPPDRILNFDKTNIASDPGKARVVVRKGTK